MGRGHDCKTQGTAERTSAITDGCLQAHRIATNTFLNLLKQNMQTKTYAERKKKIKLMP